jgi:hypothetical protein
MEAKTNREVIEALREETFNKNLNERKWNNVRKGSELVILNWKFFLKINNCNTLC